MLSHWVEPKLSWVESDRVMWSSLYRRTVIAFQSIIHIPTRLNYSINFNSSWTVACGTEVIPFHKTWGCGLFNTVHIWCIFKRSTCCCVCVFFRVLNVHTFLFCFVVVTWTWTQKKAQLSKTEIYKQRGKKRKTITTDWNNCTNMNLFDDFFVYNNEEENDVKNTINI